MCVNITKQKNLKKKNTSLNHTKIVMTFADLLLWISFSEYIYGYVWLEEDVYSIYIRLERKN